MSFRQRRFTGLVVPGDGRGRTIGFPTANLDLVDPSQLPPPGIYAASASLRPNPRLLPAVIHCGPRPMFPKSAPSFEVHLLSFPDRDLYGQTIDVTLLAALRPIENFPSVPLLQQAILRDIMKALEIFSRQSHH